MTSYKAGIKTSEDPDWVYNGMRFPTREKAEAYARDLEMRWFAVTETRVEESADEVTE